MKLLVILVVVLLLVAGGGGAAWWFLLREAPVEAVAEGEPLPENPDAARKRFIELEPIILPIIREGQVTLHLTVALAVELVEPMPEAEMASVQRPLRDAVLSILHAVYALKYIQEKGFEHPIVRDRLNRASEEVLGQGSVRGIVVRNVGTRAPATG